MTLFFFFDLCYHRSVSRAANGPYMSCQGACLWCSLTAVLPFACLTLSRRRSATAPYTKCVRTICCVFNRYKKLLMSLLRDISGCFTAARHRQPGHKICMCSFQHNLRAPFVTAKEYSHFSFTEQGSYNETLTKKLNCLSIQTPIWLF